MNDNFDRYDVRNLILKYWTLIVLGLCEFEVILNASTNYFCDKIRLCTPYTSKNCQNVYK